MRTFRTILANWLFFVADLFDQVGQAISFTFTQLGKSVEPKRQPRKPRRPSWYREIQEVRRP